MDWLFTFGLIFLVILAVALVGAAVYGSRLRRRGEANPAGEGRIRPPGAAPGGGPDKPTDTSTPPQSSHEYFKSMSLETGEDMKMRLYSLDEYKRELGGDNIRPGRFVAALKAYRPVEDEWYDYPPERAAGVLSLSPKDYEVDAERGVLLLKRLPSGLPYSSEDVL